MLERATGFAPVFFPWKGKVMLLYYARNYFFQLLITPPKIFFTVGVEGSAGWRRTLTKSSFTMLEIAVGALGFEPKVARSQSENVAATPRPENELLNKYFISFLAASVKAETIIFIDFLAFFWYA